MSPFQVALLGVALVLAFQEANSHRSSSHQIASSSSEPGVQVFSEKNFMGKMEHYSESQDMGKNINVKSIRISGPYYWKVYIETERDHKKLTLILAPEGYEDLTQYKPKVGSREVMDVHGVLLKLTRTHIKKRSITSSSSTGSGSSKLSLCTSGDRRRCRDFHESVPDLGYMKRQAFSARVYSGTWNLFADTKYKGPKLTLTPSEKEYDLSEMDFERKTESLQVEAKTDAVAVPQSGLIVYEKDDYEGSDTLYLTDTDKISVRVRSLKNTGPNAWWVFSHDHFKGTKVLIAAGVTYPNPRALRMRSIRSAKPAGCGEGYEMSGTSCVDIDECKMEGVCKEGATCSNEKGSFKCLCEEGKHYSPLIGCVQAEKPAAAQVLGENTVTMYDGYSLKSNNLPPLFMDGAQPDLRKLDGNWNDKAVSLYIGGKMKWSFYEHVDYTGKKFTLGPGRYPHLHRWAKKISSAKPSSTDEQQDGKCTCKASGDPHYALFDGQTIHFQGFCKYSFAKSVDVPDQCSFGVDVKNIRGDDATGDTGKEKVAYVRTVDVRINGNLYRLKQGKELEVNTIRRTMPYTSGNTRASVNSKFLLLENTECGITVEWDGSNKLALSVSKSRYGGKMTGICGDCNGQQDDFRLADGTILEYSRSNQHEVYGKIGHSYSVPDDLDPSYDQCELLETALDFACTPEAEEEIAGSEYCGILTDPNGAFAECLKTKPELMNGAIGVFEGCKMDTCVSWNNLDTRRATVCGMMQQLQGSCYANDVHVDLSHICPVQCPENMEYKMNVEACQPSCGDSTLESCDQPFQDMCVCKEGFILDGLKCVPEDSCGCKDDSGTYHQLGDSWMTSDCKARYYCVEKKGVASIVTKRLRGCHRYAECVAKDGDWECDCSYGFSGDGVKRCRPSIPTSKDLKVVLYPRKNFDGTAMVVTEDLPNLKDSMPEVQSMMILGATPVELFSDVQYASEKKTVRKGRLYPDITKYLLSIGSLRAAGRPSQCGMCSENAYCRGGACRCKKGYHGDGISCEKVCLCRANGDPHYNTYDGLKIDFQGKCKYTLSRYDNPSDPHCSFHVMVKNLHGLLKNGKGDVSYTEQVWLTINGTTYIINQGQKVTTADGKKVAPNILDKSGVILSQSGRYAVLNSKACNIQVYFDGDTQAMVLVSSKYSGSMTGLCGDCNGDTGNDLKTKDGQIFEYSSRTKKDVFPKVGDSFLLPDDTMPLEHRCTAGEMQTPVEPQIVCSTSVTELIKSNEYCGYIISETSPFKDTIEFLKENEHYSPENDFENCRFDLCSTWEISSEDERKKTACKALAELDESSQEVGISVSWRTERFCPMACDKETEVFMEVGPGCEPTCQHPDGDPDCNQPSREGCFVRPNYVRHNGRAIRRLDCGCQTTNGEFMEVGSSWLSNQCTTENQCEMSDGKAQIRYKEINCNPELSHCGYNEHGESECLCNAGFMRDQQGTCVPDPTPLEPRTRFKLFYGLDEIMMDTNIPVLDKQPNAIQVLDKRPIEVYSGPNFADEPVILQKGTYEDLPAMGISHVESVKIAVMPGECDPGCHRNGKCIDGECHCKRNFYGDGVHSCEEECVCTASGDPHYRTFDRNTIHFMGTCTYILSQSKDPSDECAFNVEVKNERRNSDKPRRKPVSFTRSVYVEISGTKIKLLQKKEVHVDGVKRDTPVTITRNGKTIKITTSRKEVRVSVPDCGFTVTFDGRHRARVYVPPRFKGQMNGICGDCNGIRDDYKLKNGTDVSHLDKGQKYNAIGNSYLVPDDSVELNLEKCPVTVDPTTDLVCSEEIMEEISTNKYCGLIKDPQGPFAECFKDITDNPNKLTEEIMGFYKSCTMDVCSTWDDTESRKEVTCEDLESLAADCIGRNYKVQWRTEDFCPWTCGKNMEFSPLASACEPNCLDRTPDPAQCKEEPAEGCQANPGYVMSGSESVSIDQCGCVDAQGFYHTLNSQWGDETCGTRHSCVLIDNEQVIQTEKSGPCHQHATCELTEGKYVCKCNENFQGDGVNTCEKTACASGYENEGLGCVDVNECEELGNPCEEPATCSNLPGSYKCVCPAGYADMGSKGCVELKSLGNGCAAKADVSFLIDASENVKKEQFEYLKTFVKNYASQFNLGEDGMKIMVIRINARPNVDINYNDAPDHATLDARIDSLTHIGTPTNTEQALAQVARRLRSGRRGVQKIIYVLTAGPSSSDPVRISSRLHRQGVVVKVIGLTDKVNEQELMGMSSDPDEIHLVQLEHFMELDGHYMDAAIQTCYEVCQGCAACGEDKLFDQQEGCVLKAPVRKHVPPPAVLTLFDEPEMRGRSVIVTEDTPDLNLLGFDDVAKSAVVTGALNSFAVYKENDYHEPLKTLTEGEYPDLKFADSQISSIKKLDAVVEDKVTLYDQEDMKGNMVVIYSDTPDLNNADFYRVTKSVVIEGNIGWHLYSIPQFRDAYAFLPPGTYPTVSDIGGENKLASLRMFNPTDPPSQAELYTTPDCTGMIRTITANTPNLAKLNFDHTTNCVRVTGALCWRLFAEPNYVGMMNVYCSGTYGPDKLGGTVSSLQVERRPFTVECSNVDDDAKCLSLKNRGGCTDRRRAESMFFFCRKTCSEGGKCTTCMDKYMLNEATLACEDINECTAGSENPCAGDAVCTNLPGAPHVCSCKKGFRYTADEGCVIIKPTDRSVIKYGDFLLPDLTTCPEQMSKDPTFCSSDNDMALLHCRKTCGMKKECPYGYKPMSRGTVEEVACIDIDECMVGTSIKCMPNSNCQNTNGGYDCICYPGLIGDGKVGCELMQTTTVPPPIVDQTEPATTTPETEAPTIAVKTTSEAPTEQTTTVPPTEKATTGPVTEKPASAPEVVEDEFPAPPPIPVMMDPAINEEPMNDGPVRPRDNVGDPEDLYFTQLSIPPPPPKPQPKPMGMESGVVLPDRISASSFMDDFPPNMARPMSRSAWRPEADDEEPWIEVEFERPASVHGVGILGDPIVPLGETPCFVTKYLLQLSDDGDNWVTLTGPEEDRINVNKEFDGNFETNTWKRHCLHRMYGTPFTTKFIRFRPIEGCYAMRFELYGFRDPEDADSMQFLKVKDVWTETPTGCSCYFDTEDKTCACCCDGGSQCSKSNKHQCVETGNNPSCGAPETHDATEFPEPHTLAVTGCKCTDSDSTDCPCCVKETFCQCKCQMKCVDCGHQKACEAACEPGHTTTVTPGIGYQGTTHNVYLPPLEQKDEPEDQEEPPKMCPCPTTEAP